MGHLAIARLVALIVEMMTERGITVRELASRTKIPRTTLDRSLAGVRAFNTNELFAIADALGTLPEDLIAAARAAA